MTPTIRKQVLTLYKSKLRVCRNLGYNYGDWDNRFIYNYEKLNYSELEFLIENGLIGKFAGNNIRFRYKINRKEKDNKYLKKALDYGFKMLRYLNFLDFIHFLNTED